MMRTAANFMLPLGRLAKYLSTHLSLAFRKFRDKSRPFSGLIYTFILSIFFGILYAIFIVFILIQGKVQVLDTTFDASTTNLLVSIFSQISAILIDSTLRELLVVLRLNLAGEARGTSAFTWFGIGASSQWMVTAKFAIASWLTNIWCLLRLGLPFLSLAMGSVLKFQSDFAYYFVARGNPVTVFAGLIPLDNRVLTHLPIADLCQYFLTWTSSLQSNSRYATGISVHGCKKECRALLWPGGLETVRQITDGIPNFKRSIYYNNTFNGVSAVRVNDAPGIVTTFDTIPSDFKFSLAQDCVLGDQFNDDSIKICVKQMGQSLALGWAGCPEDIHIQGNCTKNTTWQLAPMKFTTNMTAYKQFTTTTYNKRNLSIIDSKLTAKPEKMLLNATEYLEILNTIVVARNTSTQGANVSISALQYGLTWVHRTYTIVFPDEGSTLITTLENFFMIPLQFTVTAKQLVNYTLGSNSSDFQFPDDMITTVTGGSSSQRLAIQRWTGWTFIAAEATVFMFVLSWVVWMLRQTRTLHKSTGVAEIDTLISASTERCVKVKSPVRVWQRERPEGDVDILFGDLPERVTKKSTVKVGTLRRWRVMHGDSGDSRIMLEYEPVSVGTQTS